MYYKYSRRIQLNKFLGKDFSFESAEFGVEGAGTKEEAIQEVKEWIQEEIDRLKKEIKDKQNKPSLEELNEIPFTSEKIIKDNKTILKKPNK